MAKAAPFNVGITEQSPEVAGIVSDILTQEHGVHGLTILEIGPSDDLDNLDLAITSDEDELKFKYKKQDGDEEVEYLPPNAEQIQSALSRFVLNRLVIPVSEQTSRRDSHELESYMGIRPNIESDPSEWIVGNPLIGDLTRRHAKYGNLIRYLCNERGLFLKVGNYPKERAYWNSSLNGGLPVYKKSDPIHEGTFMLHDVLHYVPVDPIIGTAEDTPSRKGAYIAHRMLSEATTLVLADMVAVHDAKLDDRGYDVSKRRIFPVYHSIIVNTGHIPEVDKLLAANAYFCFTGDVSGFRELGASDDALADYQAKYESVFSDDFKWNLHNYEAMVEERESNEAVKEYFEWLENTAKIRSLRDLDQVTSRTQEGIDIARLLSLFRGDFKTAFAYQDSIDDKKRLRAAHSRYLAGQRMVFARFASVCSPEACVDNFDANYNGLLEAETAEEVSTFATIANAQVDEYIDRLSKQGLLLPHEEALYRFTVPTYPIRFVNYHRNTSSQEATFQDQMAEFVQTNRDSLRRVLEATK